MTVLDSGEYLLRQEEILEYLKNRPPLLFIQSVKVVPGKCAVSEKNLSDEEWFFSCHFPGNPMMPGVLQLETMFQTAAMAIKTLDGYREKTTNIAQIRSVKYIDHIRPGDTIRVEARVKQFRRGLAEFDAIILNKGKKCSVASFLLVVLDDIPALEDNNGIDG